MKKTFFCSFLILCSLFTKAQINVVSTTNGSITIAPNGVKGKYPATPYPSNIAIGQDALLNNTYSFNNIAIGQNALKFQSFSNSNTDFPTFNIAIGHNALFSNNPSTTALGTNNIALGSFALYDNITGQFNYAIGTSALAGNKTNHSNLAVGSFAMSNYDDRTTGGRNTHNTAIGHSALAGLLPRSGNTGRYNTAIGKESLYTNSSGDHNTSTGYKTSYSNTTGQYSSAFGSQALFNNTSGNYNTAIGYFTLFENVANHRSTAIGYGAMERANNTITGIDTYNTAVGVFALRGSLTPELNTGINNTAIGDLAMSSNMAGSQNVAVGTSAYSGNTSGSNNTIIGYQAGLSTTAGSGNVFIGNLSGSSFGTTNNALVIENSNTSQGLIMGDFQNNKVGINRLWTDLGTRAETFQVEGEAFKTSGTGNWIIPSDRRLKENIVYLNSQEILAKVLIMKGVSYNWKDRKRGNDKVFGFIAQDLQAIFPENIKTDKEGFLSASYGAFDPMIIESIKALKELIDEQKRLLVFQQNEIISLKNKVNLLSENKTTETHSQK